MFNIFRKKKTTNTDDKQKMGMLQVLAMKKMMKMSPQEKEKLAQEMMRPENKTKLLSAMEMMKKTGQITDEQIEEAKKKMGL